MKSKFTHQHFLEENRFLLPSKAIMAIVILFLSLLLNSSTFGQIAPISTPTGGFHIDGNLRANTPTAGIGDWLPSPVGTSGSGGFVMSDGGVPVNPATTQLLVKDAYNSTSDLVFKGGNKFDGNPNTDWGWTASKPTGKDDINNAMYHLYTDGTNRWLIIGSDRLATTGTSYIDFEFLQKTLTRNPSGGGFTSAGLDGGRTVDDIVISMEYTGGGSTAKIHFYKWEKVGTGFDWVEYKFSVDGGPIPDADAFGMTNVTSTPVPFLAFGQTSYIPYSFVEAAVNLTGLFGAINPCLGLKVKTILIKTKASDALTATLKDFMEPIQVSLNFNAPSIDDQGPFCSDAASITLTASPSGGTFSGDGVSGTTFSPSVAGPGTHTITYTYTQSGCAKTATTDIVVNAKPTVTAGSYGPYCSDAGAVTLGGTPAGGTWSGTGVSLVSGVYKFTPSAAGVGTYTLTYSYTDGNSCSNSATASVVVNTKPTVTAGSYGPYCIDAAAVTLGGSPSGGTWSGDGVSGAAGSQVFTPSTAGAGSHTLTYSYTDGNSCSNSATASVVVNTKPTVTAGSYGPYCIDAAAVTLGGSPSGGTWSGDGVSGAAGSQVFTPSTAGAGSHTLTYSYTDGNSCSNSATASVVVNTKPTVTAGSYGPYCIDAAAVTLGGSPSGGTWSGDGVSGAAGSQVFTPSTAGAGSHTLTYSYTDGNSCSNSATASVVVNTKPTVTAGSYGPYCIDAAAVTLGGSPSGGTWSGDGVSGAAGSQVFTPSTAGAGSHTLTYSYTDGNSCSNSATASVVVNTKPTVTAGSYGPYCIDAAAVTLGGSPSGGTWSGDGVSGAAGSQVFTPSTAGAGSHTLTYSYTDGNSCSNSATTDVVVNSSPSFTVCIVQPTLCSKGSLTINATGGSGFTYTIDGRDFSNTTGVFSDLGAASVTTVQVKNSDGCASADVSCANLVSDCSAPSVSQRTMKSVPTTTVITEQSTTVKAYPNPFNDKVKFVVNAGKSGNGTLEIYNVLGQKIKTVYHGYVPAGVNNFDLNLSGQKNANLIYRFVLDNKVVTGKLIQLNR